MLAVGTASPRQDKNEVSCQETTGTVGEGLLRGHGSLRLVSRIPIPSTGPTRAILHTSICTLDGFERALG